MEILDGKTAIITGAAKSRGIGIATAELFAMHGARVAIIDLKSMNPKQKANKLGDQHLGAECDVSNKDECSSAVNAILAEFSQIDILVNNAGIVDSHKIEDIEPEDFNKIIDVNLRGTMYMSQLVIPRMKARKTGSIINISSVAAQRGGGIFGGPHYCAAKAGILGLTKAMARELAPDQIRSNAICPGFIETDIIEGRITTDQKQQILSGIPMGHGGQANDVAGCALFLASEFSKFVTGTTIDVNGGSHIH